MIAKRRSFRVLAPALGLALVAVLSLGAVGAASASATTQHWYACHNVGAGGGLYGDAFCGKIGAPYAYDSYRLPEGSPTSLKMSSVTGFSLKWKWSGVQITINCTTQESGGTVENPKGGLGGTASQSGFVLTGCTVSGPEGCALPGKKITFSNNVGAATEFEGKPAVKFTPTGASVAEFKFEGCKTPGFNTTMKIVGSFTGIGNKAAGSLEFTKTSSNLLFGVNPVTFEGTSKIETSAGEPLSLAP